MVEPLPPESLRWRCDPASLDFDSTAEVEPIAGIVGQSSALEALRFGIETDAPGQNVFVRGLVGTGRMTMIRRLLTDLMPTCRLKQDRCYVHDFSAPDRPRLITLPTGHGQRFRRRVREVADFIRDGLPEALSSTAVKARREALENRARVRIEDVTRPFEEALTEARFAMVQRQQGPIVQTAIFPAIDGVAVPPEELAKLHSEGKVTDADIEHWKKSREGFAKRLGEVSQAVQRIRAETSRAIAAVLEDTAREILGGMVAEIRDDFPGEDVAAFLRELVADVVDKLGEPRLEGEDPLRFYGVNVLISNVGDDACPIVVENTPTLANLLGTVDREWSSRGPGPSDYRMIRSGSLLRADGGYLILDARDVVQEPGAWKVLMRTLRTGRLEIVPAEITFPWAQPTVKPEPIPVKLRVLLVGDADTYFLLDHYDPDFGHLFKVLADFDSEIDREPEGVRQYAAVLAHLAKEEGLLPFHRTAVAALVEHGARIAARAGKLTARFARVGDIAREAAFVAGERQSPITTGDDVSEAIRRTKRRGDLPSRQFRSYVRDGTIRIQTQGTATGQINGLAVIHAGPLTYGFPARITASLGPGSAGIIDIEGQAALSGQIHTKGFHILGGLLRNLLRTEHPLAFSASLAFEQSYGGIDGDSASGAEILCLLSALTGVPLRQDLAITGAIDQHGALQAIGGVTEKIEGFFDTCEDAGLSGTQGVIIPLANAGDLMLRENVVEACASGRFHVYAVATVQEALEILTGRPTGVRDAEGSYPEDSVLGIAVQKAYAYWQMTLRGGGMDEVGSGEEQEEDSAPEPPDDDMDDG